MKFDVKDREGNRLFSGIDEAHPFFDMTRPKRTEFWQRLEEVEVGRPQLREDSFALYFVWRIE